MDAGFDAGILCLERCGRLELDQERQGHPESAKNALQFALTRSEADGKLDSGRQVALKGILADVGILGFVLTSEGGFGSPGTIVLLECGT